MFAFLRDRSETAASGSSRSRMARLSYSVPVCRDRHLYRIQNARFPKTVPWRPRICQPRVHGRPERLRNFGVLSLAVYSPVWQIAARNGERGREGRFSKLSSSLLGPSPDPLLPFSRHELPSRVLGILARFSHARIALFFPSASFSLACPDPLVHHRPCLQARTRPTFFDTSCFSSRTRGIVWYHYSNIHVRSFHD